MIERKAEPDTKPILDYAVRTTREPPGLGWPIFLAILQFFWIAFCILEPLGWDRPKQLLRDSLFYALAALPSVAAVIVNFRICWYVCHSRRLGPIFVCLCAFLISAVMTGLIIHGWVIDVALDPYGRWYPL